MELLPSYKDLKHQLPLSADQSHFVQQSRSTIRHILKGNDPRLLLIVGPCSIHDTISALAFATQLKALASEVSHSFFIVMRTYCEKPRTATGWPGFLYDPHLDGSYDIQMGIYKTRQLLLELIHLQVPTATEFLDPLTAFYHDDLISWGSIGARTSSSQPHRHLATCLDMPIGIKNGVTGLISSAINGIRFASQPQTSMGLDENMHPFIRHAKGNPDVHVVLRGGETGPNYDAESIQAVLERLRYFELPLQLIVDCSHHNSGKQPEQQIYVFQHVIDQYIQGNQAIKGLMLESHLFSGAQILSDPKVLKYGISITDPCLDWQQTAHLIKNSSHTLERLCINYR